MLLKNEEIPRIDLLKPWRISHELSRHTDDVKALSVVRTRDPDLKDELEAFVSASRDETAVVWKRKKPSKEPGNRPPSQWLNGNRFTGKRYQNSVATYDDAQREGLGLLMMGGLDARILVFRLDDSESSDVAEHQPLQILQDHYDNVCHLSVSTSFERESPDVLLISASWDCTSRVWRLQPDAKHGSLWSPLHTLKGHQAAVWAAEIVDCNRGSERYLTASADHFVRLWEGEEVVRIFAGHTDVARGIVLLPPATPSVKTHYSDLPIFYDDEKLFATISNDSSIRVWSLDQRRWPVGNSGSGGDPVRILTKTDGLSDILYDVCFVGLAQDSGHRLIATSGEGGQVNIWNVEKAECVTSIAQPVTSAWSIVVLPLSGDLITADSDGKVRVYTQRTFNTSFMAQERRLEVRARGGQIELDRQQMQLHEEKCAEISERRTRRQRNGMEVDIVAVEGASSQHLFEGERYDCLLKIDVRDDDEPLTLPINKGDDAIAKAKDFIAKYSLSTNYQTEIVAFIHQFGPG